MPAALQTVTFFKQALTGGAWEALAAATGDSATFFNVPQGSGPFLAEVWAINDASPMEVSLIASRFHDQTLGIRSAIPDGDLVAPTDRATLISPVGFDQPIYPSDVLTVQVFGVAADNANVTLQLYYPDLPGIAGRFMSPQEVRSRLKNLVGIRVSPTTGAGTYGATVALNSVESRLHANTDYAILGMTCQTPASAIVIQGVDTGNMRVGMPVLADAGHDAHYFADLSDALNVPLIPVINANNAGATTIAAAHTAAAAHVVDILMAELR